MPHSVEVETLNLNGHTEAWQNGKNNRLSLNTPGRILSTPSINRHFQREINRELRNCLVKMWISASYPRHSNLESEAGNGNLHFDRLPWGSEIH